VQGTAALGRTHLALLAALTLVCILTLWNPPARRPSWCLEVVPGLAYIAVLAAVWRRFPVSRIVAVGIFLHVLILIYGGVYTYARTPLGNWAREAFHLHRNHYDRVGHFALGFFPVLTIREVLLRRTPLQRGAWLTFLLLSVVLAIGAFWELIEWWTTLVVAGDTGTAFLGSQGDVWDAQWDMLMALIGAAVALPLLSKAHDRSMAALGVYR
jgi:putative membrane protein